MTTLGNDKDRDDSNNDDQHGRRLENDENHRSNPESEILQDENLHRHHSVHHNNDPPSRVACPPSGRQKTSASSAAMVDLVAGAGVDKNDDDDSLRPPSNVLRRGTLYPEPDGTHVETSTDLRKTISCSQSVNNNQDKSSSTSVPQVEFSITEIQENSDQNRNKNQHQEQQQHSHSTPSKQVTVVNDEELSSILDSSVPEQRSITSPNTTTPLPLEPDGVMPNHRVNQSRRFSDEFMVGNELTLLVGDFETGGDKGGGNGNDPKEQSFMEEEDEDEESSSPRSTPPSPPSILKEVTFSHIDELQQLTSPASSPDHDPDDCDIYSSSERHQVTRHKMDPRLEPESCSRQEQQQPLPTPQQRQEPEEAPPSISAFPTPTTVQYKTSTSMPLEQHYMMEHPSDMSVLSLHSVPNIMVSSPFDPTAFSMHPTIVAATHAIENSNSSSSVPHNRIIANVNLSQMQPHVAIPTLVPSTATNTTNNNNNGKDNNNNGYHHPHPHHVTVQSTVPQPPPPPSTIMMLGKRKIHLRLVEDVIVPNPTHTRTPSSFLPFRKIRSNRILFSPASAAGGSGNGNGLDTHAEVQQQQQSQQQQQQQQSTQMVDRGRLTVSWYDGTTSLDLYEHVRNCVKRKLGLHGTAKLSDLRIMDETVDPPEEIVLSPYIPSGSRLLLRFSIKDAGGDVTPVGFGYYGLRSSTSSSSHYMGGAPDSPSAAPSPYASSLNLEGLGLNPNQLALLGARLKGLQVPNIGGSEGRESSASSSRKNKKSRSSSSSSKQRKSKTDREGKTPSTVDSHNLETEEKQHQEGEENAKEDDEDGESSSTVDMNSLHPEDPIQKSLQKITELLVADRDKRRYVPKQEKRQVVFVLANYFVLFLSLIAISAEIQARAPGWNAAIEQHLNSVKNCSKDQDALFECVTNGDLAGLVASVVLWISRSAATKRIFLFGFDSPRKLWTVVYESMVTAVCWGFSYMFIRRGMNPDTNRNFLQKYWKDAVYGSLAGFNAAFMKHVLKNLVPQEAIEDAFQEKAKLKIFSWLPSFEFE